MSSNKACIECSVCREMTSLRGEGEVVWTLPWVCKQFAVFFRIKWSLYATVGDRSASDVWILAVVHS